jgi:hypothetical protein
VARTTDGIVEHLKAEGWLLPFSPQPRVPSTRMTAGRGRGVEVQDADVNEVEASRDDVVVGNDVSASGSRDDVVVGDDVEASTSEAERG